MARLYCVAFIIDVFAGYIVGWRGLTSMETTFVLGVLEQALWARRRLAPSNIGNSQKETKLYYKGSFSPKFEKTRRNEIQRFIRMAERLSV